MGFEPTYHYPVALREVGPPRRCQLYDNQQHQTLAHAYPLCYCERSAAIALPLPRWERVGVRVKIRPDHLPLTDYFPLILSLSKDHGKLVEPSAPCNDRRRVRFDKVSTREMTLGTRSGGSVPFYRCANKHLNQPCPSNQPYPSNQPSIRHPRESGNPEAPSISDRSGTHPPPEAKTSEFRIIEWPCGESGL